MASEQAGPHGRASPHGRRLRPWCQSVQRTTQPDFHFPQRKPSPRVPSSCGRKCCFSLLSCYFQRLFVNLGSEAFRVSRTVSLCRWARRPFRTDEMLGFRGRFWSVCYSRAFARKGELIPVPATPTPADPDRLRDLERTARTTGCLDLGPVDRVRALSGQGPGILPDIALRSVLGALSASLRTRVLGSPSSHRHEAGSALADRTSGGTESRPPVPGCERSR